MRIAHIIMVHKNPEQLIRLINRLNHPDFDFYIHVDKKVPLQSFESIKDLPRVSFIKNRIDCNWGGNSLFKGILSSLNELISINKHYDFVNLLSAQDYPLKSLDYIHKYFENNLGTNFISYDTSKESEWWQKAVLRYEKHHFTDLNFKGKYFVQKIVNMIFPNRKFPLDVVLYGGSKSTWWTLSGPCAEYVSKTFNNNKELTKFLKYSWGTDEFALATIIMNSEHKDNTVNDNLRYIDWSEGNAHPKLLASEDLENLKSSDMLFARKFDMYTDGQVLDDLDHIILKN